MPFKKAYSRPQPQAEHPVEEQMSQEQDEYVAPMQPSHDFLNSAENLRYITESNTFQERIERLIRGLEYNAETDKWEPKYKAWANEEGINRILFWMQYIDKEVKFANYDPELIPQIISRLGKLVATDFHSNYKEYKMSKMDARNVSHFVADMAYSSYTRGSEAHEKRFMRSAQFGLMYQPPITAQEQKKGWLNRVNPFGR